MGVFKEELEIKATIQISKSPEEVFEGIVDSEKMSNYFISESTGRMKAGERLEWKFPEFDETAEVEVLEVNPHSYVSFNWEGAKGKTLKVEITLSEMPNGSTVVKVTEGKMPNDEIGLAWYGGNTEGWANFLACLKAYLEYGINLRKGAFDFMRKEKG